MQARSTRQGTDTGGENRHPSLGHVRSSDVVEAPDYSMSLSKAKRWLREDLRQSFQDWFRDQATIKDHEFRKVFEFPKRGQLGVPEGPRRLQGIVMAALSSHGDFATYHLRRKHQNATLRCPRCGVDKDETHEWSCKQHPNSWGKKFVQKLPRSIRGRKTLMQVLIKREAPLV
ncbi:hypothetical protein Cpir12675_000771 [Ceratocystis pirilliformis]|uniref:Uncharacterized protein n=1 Tax=Ceratocystis pirilliformis TaxID=259994 RepID=A0ABR3ZKJ0_9PEZI